MKYLSNEFPVYKFRFHTLEHENINNPQNYFSCNSSFQEYSINLYIHVTRGKRLGRSENLR